MELPTFPAEYLDLQDDKLGLHLLAWWIGFQAKRKGIPSNGVTEEIAEKIRLATLGMDVEDARHVALEKALRRVASGDAAGGGKLFRDLMREGGFHLAALEEAVTGERRQRANAKRPRPDALQILICEIVANEPEITVTELLAVLNKYPRGQVIDEITQDEICFVQDGHGGNSAPVSGLKDRLSRARKRIKSR